MKLPKTDQKFLRETARRLLSCPTAPFFEHRVRDEVERFCREHSLNLELDQYGNALVWLRAGGRGKPLVLAAHLDHPGFEVTKIKSKLTGQFNGGVGEEFFKPGVRVRLHPGNHPAELGKRKGARKFELICLRKLSEEPQFATWDLPDFCLRGDRIIARACDDLIGVSSVLATMAQLKRAKAPVNVVGALTRAEEVGFRGALAIAADRAFPKNALLISLETSRELPGVQMGKGVILRVGDKASIFGSRAMRFLGEVAKELGERRKDFAYQRALMSGGTCEATAYQEYGYEVGAVCIALGNYHNCGSGNKIAAEEISLFDACSMTDLLMETAARMRDYTELIGRLPARLRGLRREARARLKKTAMRSRSEKPNTRI